jgi:hypothetical protein
MVTSNAPLREDCAATITRPSKEHRELDWFDRVTAAAEEAG